MEKVVVFSVVRDFATYGKCIRDNSNCGGCTLVPIDNRSRNEPIPACYNRAVAARPADEEAWYVFCHEDFQPLEDLAQALGKMAEETAKQSIWGPVGVSGRRIFGIFVRADLLGEFQESTRAGEKLALAGRRVPCGTEVETFDCQCVIVHSTLLRRTGLRFDENLTFDLYAEDFCIAAKENHGVASRILPLAVRHWSDSEPKPRFYRQLKYLNRKWRHVRRPYMGVFSSCIGGGFGLRRLNSWAKNLVWRVWNMLY